MIKHIDIGMLNSIVIEIKNSNTEPNVNLINAKVNKFYDLKRFLLTN